MFDALVETRPHIRTYYEDMDNPRLKKLFQNPKGLLDLLIRYACRTEEFDIPECVANLKEGFITAAYTTEKLAELMGVSRNTIGNWLNELEALGVLDRPFNCASTRTRNIYVLGYCYPVPMKEAGGFKRAFVYYINDPLPPKTAQEIGQSNTAQEIGQSTAQEIGQSTAQEIGQKHISHESQEGSEHKRQPTTPALKRIMPGANDTKSSGTEPRTVVKNKSGASGRAKADPNGKSNMLNGSGVSKVEFRHNHENEIIAAFEKKYREVEGMPYEADGKDRTKLRHLLKMGHPKDEIIAAIGFYISARSRFSWGNGVPTLTTLATPKFYARLAARDKTLFVAARQDSPNSGDAASEAEAPIVNKLKEIWS